MKNILILVSIASMLIFTGCVEKQIILVPQSEYYPTFNTSDFNTSESYKLTMWAQKDRNGTAVCSEQSEMLGLIEDTKTLRSNYNVLLKELNKFNKIILEMNEIQRNKKPKEVDSIPNSWFK